MWTQREAPHCGAKADSLTPDAFGRLPTPVFDRSGRHQQNLPTPLASSEAVGTNKTRQTDCCLTELGVSGQRRLSVGGAITHFRHWSLEFSRARQATSTRKAARGYAATVGFRLSD
jgi:hypothetical protein